MSYLKGAMKMKPTIEKAVQSLPDADALIVKTMYPKWEDLVKLGQLKVDAGYRFYYGGDLYRCIQVDPRFQADWMPGAGTGSLYTRIDETYEGTIDDPIPYEGNMALELGKYYSQGGVTYYCFRDTGIPVYNALAELVGLYVEAAA